jgi:hypothetical protein
VSLATYAASIAQIRQPPGVTRLFGKRHRNRKIVIVREQKSPARELSPCEGTNGTKPPEGAEAAVSSNQGDRTMERIQTQITFLQVLIDGLKARYGASTKLTLTTGTYTVKDLAELLQQLVDAHQGVLTVRTKVKSATKARSTKSGEIDPIVKALKGYLLNVYGDPHDLASFGLKPPKPRTSPTAKAKAEAVDKAQATRRARHTMGTHERQAVHAEPVVSPQGAGAPTNGASHT